MKEETKLKHKLWREERIKENECLKADSEFYKQLIVGHSLEQLMAVKKYFNALNDVLTEMIFVKQLGEIQYYAK